MASFVGNLILWVFARKGLKHRVLNRKYHHVNPELREPPGHNNDFGYSSRWYR